MGKFESYPEANALSDNDITLYNKNAATHKITFGTIINLIREKLTENGLVSSITTGVGLLGGTITSTGTIKCNLVSERNARFASNSITDMPSRQYAVTPDKNGRLSVNIPWTDNGKTYEAGDGIKLTGDVFSAELKSTTKSQLIANPMGYAVNRQYAVGLDAEGKLSVCIPWTETNAGLGLAQVGNTSDIKVKIASETLSSLTATARTTTANREYPVGLDSNGNLSVNVPWTDNSGGGGGGGGMNTDGSNADPEVTFSGAFTVGTRLSGSVVGQNSVAEGLDITAQDFSHAEGHLTQANGTYSHAEGEETKATKPCSHAEGGRTKATGNYSHVEGYNNEAYGANSHAEGRNTQATGSDSHAEGYTTKASGTDSHAEGYGTTAKGGHSHAEGYNTKTEGYAAHAEGYGCWAYGDESHAEGMNTTAWGKCGHVGGYGITTYLPYSFAYGGNNYIFGDSSSNNNNKGVFGIQPTCEYYSLDTTLTDDNNNAKYGKGGSLAKGVTLSTSIEPNKAIYMLMSVSYDQEANDEIKGMATHMIATTNGSIPSVLLVSSTSSVPLSITGEFTDDKCIIHLKAHSSYRVLFHLIRIM